MRLHGWNQGKLSSAKVIVVGVGALGCEIAKNLALMGIGELLLVDNDYVELSNLSRQMLYTDEDISKPKALVAERKIREMNPLVRVSGIQTDVRKIPEEVFSGVDVVVSAVDNWPTRRWINSMVVVTNKPLVDVATDGYYGNVQVVIPGKTCCLECHAENLIPAEIQASECSLRRKKPAELVDELKEKGIQISLEDAEKLFEQNIKTIYDIKFAPATVLASLESDLRHKVLEMRDYLTPKMPALQSVSATISGLGVFEVVRLLHSGSFGQPFSGLMMFDGLTPRLSRIKLEKNPHCHVCGHDAEKAVEITVSANESIADLKEKISNLFMFPDTRIQRGTRLLEESSTDIGSILRDGDIVYIHSSRRATPLVVKVKFVENSN